MPDSKTIDIDTDTTLVLPARGWNDDGSIDGVHVWMPCDDQHHPDNAAFLSPAEATRLIWQISRSATPARGAGRP